MKLFSKNVFWTVFGITLSAFLTVSLAVVATRGMLAASNVLMAVLAAVGISVALAALIAGYRLPVRWTTWAYRAVMRRLAKRAIRSSLTQAMTPIKCLGIMEREGYVQLRLDIGLSSGITEGFSFRLLESTDNRQWGMVEVVNVGDTHSDCIPIVRSNEDFWAALEDRMRYDTSSPSNIHLVIDLPESYMEWTEWLLDNWGERNAGS